MRALLLQLVEGLLPRCCQHPMMKKRPKSTLDLEQRLPGVEVFVEAAALAEWEAECGAYAIRRFARHNRVQAIVSRIDDVDDNAAIGVFFPSIALSPGRAVTHGHGGHPSTGHSSAAYPPPPPRPARHHVSMRQMLPTAPTPPPPTSMDGLISAAKTFLASGALTKSQESPAFTSAFPQ